MLSNERSTGSNKSGRFGRVGLRQLKLIGLSVSADEGLRGRNVLTYLTLCYVRCSTSSLLVINHVAMSLYSIKTNILELLLSKDVAMKGN